MGIHTGPALHNGALYGLGDHASFLTLTLAQRVMATAYIAINKGIKQLLMGH